MDVKLTGTQRKKIIAEYIVGDGKISQQKLANKYGVSRQAISKILRDEESCEKLRNKKRENEMSMLAFLDDRADKAQAIIDKILDVLPNDIEKSSMRDKAGLLKILAETFTGAQDKHHEDDEITEVEVKWEDASESDDEASS